MRPRTCLAAALPLALLVTAACSGDDGGATTTGGGTGSGGGLLATVSGALDTLPDTGEPADEIVWGDLERAAEIAGIERRPTRPRDDDAPPYIRAVTGGTTEDGETSTVALVPPEVVHAERADELMAFDDDVGWTILDVDRYVERTTAPGVISVLQGEFDDDDMNEALGQPEEGVWVAGPRQDYAEDPDAVTPARPSGEAQWLARDGDYLTITRAAGDSAAVRRSLAGVEDTPSFGDDTGLAGVAGALDAQAPYGAVLVRPGPAAGRAAGRSPSQAGDAASVACLPAPTTAAGTGITDEDGPVLLVALAHGTADEAAANAEAVAAIAEGGTLRSGQAMSDLVTVDDVATTGDGLVVVARLRPAETAPALLWYQLLAYQEPLVSSC